jgi:subtilase family serine protease
VCALSAFALALGFATTASAAQNHERLIRDSINDTDRVTLAGNTHPEAIPANDRGILRDEAPMNGLQLVLHRSPEAEAAFEQYISELHNPKSALFHKWLTNQQIGDRFGASDEDIDTVKEWLSSKGLHVSNVSPDRMSIEFSGDAGHVRDAFQAPLHNLVVDGRAHISNMNDPSMPHALAAVVTGVAKLNDFMPRHYAVPRPQATGLMKNGNGGGGYNYLGAADLATIYDINPVFKAGVTGKGQTIVLIEDTNLYSAGDWQVFRKVLGLSRAYPYGTLTQVNPAGTANACANPGVITYAEGGDDVEAAIDVEWASATAPNAAIELAACADTFAQFGGFLALANLLTEVNPPQIVSISYGDSESVLGAVDNLYINNLYASGAAEGVSIFVSSGDELAASSDNGNVATHGITVSGFTSTPYNISVGGTDFAAEPLGEYSTYFSSTDGPNFKTALSYIPEIPWNDSCAGSVVVDYIGGGMLTQAGPSSLCNYEGGTLANDYGLLNAEGGSGGPSACATGKAATRGVANGTCAGYAKPGWQSVYGNPSDTVRDIPDVSLMAANGLWGVYYAVCISDPTGSSGFTPCGANPAAWAGYGGTSISSPIWAGIQALVNQSTGSAWGNSNNVLYGLADEEYGVSGDPSCSSTLGNAIGASCVFNDVTLGDNAGACDSFRTGDVDCYLDGAEFGILSTSNTTELEAYPTGTGWDFPTGIGTPNVFNLVAAWPPAPHPTTKPILLDKKK